MLKRYITAVATQAPVQELSDEALKQLRKNFKPLAARRLTALPLLIGELTKNAVAEPDDEWVFASEYGGALSLEKFLNSFPTPSPTHFQNSIQPGPLDLINVSRRKPAKQLVPIIGEDSLFAESLMAALISPAKTVHLVGGEEFSQWAANHQLGASSTYAYYLQLNQQADNALGEVEFSPGAEGSALYPERAATLLELRQPMAAHLPDRGLLQITWR